MCAWFLRERAFANCVCALQIGRDVIMSSIILKTMIHMFWNGMTSVYTIRVIEMAFASVTEFEISSISVLRISNDGCCCCCCDGRFHWVIREPFAIFHKWACRLDDDDDGDDERNSFVFVVVCKFQPTSIEWKTGNIIAFFETLISLENFQWHDVRARERASARNKLPMKFFLIWSLCVVCAFFLYFIQVFQTAAASTKSR